MRRFIRKIIFRFLVRIQRWARKKDFRAALQIAQQRTNETGRTCLIFFIDGEYQVHDKRTLTRLRNRGKAFRGMSNEEIEKMADVKTYGNGKRKTAG
jgi:hypothetical protein